MSTMKELTDAGYKELRNDSFQLFKATDILFQKKVKDEKGIRYIINCWYYEKDFITFQEDVVQFEVQYTLWDGENCNVDPFYKDIKQAEEFFDIMWHGMNFGYCELYH